MMNNIELKTIWNELTDYTYIYGCEDEVAEIMNKYLSTPIQRDEYGNYFIKIGESKTLFFSHLDSVRKQKLKVNKVGYIENGMEYVKTDGFTILGADDKTGVVIMMNMIENNIPGLYYFVMGEEVGEVGSSLLRNEKTEMLKQYDRCVSFDRKWYGSIINRQLGEYCCSDEFVKALSIEFKKHGMKYKADPYGVGTDSAVLMGIIPECTNLSVGYNKEHTFSEHQNMDYMLTLADVATKINWESLPTVRIPTDYDSEKPKIVKKKDSDLPEYKLRNIFEDVDDIIYDNIKLFASNGKYFEPNKEMRYFNVKDLKGEKKFVLFIYWDGKIEFIKNKYNIIFENFNDFKNIIKNDVNILKRFLGIPIEDKKIIATFEQFKNKVLEQNEPSNYGKVLYVSFKGTYYFDMIIDGIKKEEYREIKPFWESRLDGKTYDTVKIVLGRQKNAPTIYVECLGIEKGGEGNKAWGWEEPCYKIKLGKILNVENYDRKI